MATDPDTDPTVADPPASGGSAAASGGGAEAPSDTGGTATAPGSGGPSAAPTDGAAGRKADAEDRGGTVGDPSPGMTVNKKNLSIGTSLEAASISGSTLTIESAAPPDGVGADGNFTAADLAIGQANGVSVKVVVNNGRAEAATALIATSAVDGATVARLEHVFAKPAGFDEAVRQADRRVFVVSGTAHTGRFATAVMIGLRLVEDAPPDAPPRPVDPADPKAKPWLERIRHGSTRGVFLSDLSHLVGQLRDADGSVYIIDDAFRADGLGASALAEMQVAAATKLLADRKSWLILRRESAPGADPRFAGQVESALAPDRLPGVFVRHLEWAASQTDKFPVLSRMGKQLLLAAQGNPDLLAGYDSPSQVYRMCYLIEKDARLLDPKLPPEQVARALADVVKKGLDLNDAVAVEWWATLTVNQRLFGLLLHLFRGLPRRTLETFYTEVVTRLREGENGRGGLAALDDARTTGFDELYRALWVDADEMTFQQPLFARYVARRVEGYSHLLWSVVEQVKATVVLFRAPRYWQFRRLLGDALGRFAEGRFDTLKSVLNDLAGSEYGGVNVVAAYALQHICRSTAAHDADVADLIQTWERSGDADLVWSAVVAASHCLTALAARPPGAPSPATGDRPATTITDTLRETLGSAATRKLNPTELERRIDESAQAQIRALPAGRRGRADASREAGAKAILAAAEQHKQDVRAARAADIAQALSRSFADLIAEAPADTLAFLCDWLGTSGGTSAKADGGGDPPDRAAAPHDRRARGLLAFRILSDAVARAAPKEDGTVVLTAVAHEQLRKRLPELLPKMMRAAVGDDDLQKVLLNLAGWLTVDEWQGVVSTAVFDAANDADADTRAAVQKHLRRTWLDDAEMAGVHAVARDRAYSLARKALTRGQLIEGALCDLPGGGKGLILIDQCPLERGGSADDDARNLAFQLFLQFSTQFDVVLGWFGSPRLIDPNPPRRDGGPNSPAGLRRTIRAPRLLGPALDELERREGTESPHFVLAPTWAGRVDDRADFAPAGDGAGHPWGDRVLLEPMQGELAKKLTAQDAADLAAAAVVRAGTADPARAMEIMWAAYRDVAAENRRVAAENHNDLQRMNEKFQPKVSAVVARRLATRTRDRWWELLAPHVGALTPDPDSVERRLRDVWHDTTGAHEHDPVRVGIGLLHWLAATDFDRAIGAVGWLLGASGGGASGDGRPGVPVGIAIAAARNLFRIHVLGALPDDRAKADPARFAAFLRQLAPALAAKETRPWPLLLDLIFAALGYADRPDWATAVWPAAADAPLPAVARAARPELRAALLALMKAVVKANVEAATAPGADPARADALRDGTRMAERFLTALRDRTADLDPNKSLLLFVIEDDTRCDRFVEDVLEKYGVGGTETEQVAAVRLGETRPYPLTDVKPKHPARVDLRPRLLGPVLDRLSGWTVGRLVVVTALPPLDLHEVDEALLREEEDPATRHRCPAILVVDSDKDLPPSLNLQVVGRKMSHEDRVKAVEDFLKQTRDRARPHGP